MTINDELNIHDDAFRKNYLWVKLFDFDDFCDCGLYGARITRANALNYS